MSRSPAAVINALRERASALAVGLSLATVSLATGFISYTHISALTIHEGGSWKSAHLYPLAVDGQIAAGMVVLMEVKTRHRWWGLAGFLPGLGESLIANWASGYAGHNLAAALWATVPAQAFACSTFLFEMWLRYRRSVKPAAQPVSETISQAPEPAAPVAQEAAPVPVHLHGAPEGAPWGLVSPAAAPASRPQPAPAFSVPLVGPSMALAQRPASRPRAVKVADDTRLPLPADPGELAAALAGLSRNKIFETYRVSKGKASTLVAARDEDRLAQWLEQYLDDREVA